MSPPLEIKTKNVRFQSFVITLFLVVGFLIYCNTFNAAFQFDDDVSIINNPSIRHPQNISWLWKSFNTRLVTGYTFALNYALGRLNVTGYHLVNIVIHILASICVYVFVLLTLQTPYFRKTQEGRLKTLTALFAGLLFLAHPIQTQAVTYITQRAASLASLFYLGTLIFYVRSRLTGKGFYRFIALISAILGMFTKEITFSIPFALVIYEFFFFENRKDKIKETLKDLIPFFFTLLIIPLTLLSDTPKQSILNLKIQLIAVRFNPYFLLTEVNAARTYLRLLFLPIRQIVDYDYPVSIGFFSLSTFPSFLVLGFLCVWAVREFRRMRLISFGIVWFFITMSVEFIIRFLIGRDFIFEHHLYLAVVGFAVCLTHIFLEVLKDQKKAVVTLSCIVVMLSILTHQRNRVWQTPITLWEDAVKKSPSKPRPHNNLGLAYSNIGRYEDAIEHYKYAIWLDLNYAGAYSNLGVTLGRKGEYDEAIKYLQTAIDIDPQLIEAYTNLGFAYAQKGDYDKAISYYRKTFGLKPQTARIFTNLSAAYGKKGNYDKEIEYGLTAITLDPDNSDAYNNLGLAYVMKGEYEVALRYFNKVIELNPGFSHAYNNLGLFYIRQGDQPKAKEMFEKALELDPDNREAQNNLRLMRKNSKVE